MATSPYVELELAFDTLTGRSRFYTTLDIQTPGAGEAERQFLNAKVLKDGKTPSAWLDNTKHIQSWARNVDGRNWTAEQAWGFEEINGKRYYTRRVVVKKGDQVVKARLVYDYTK